jgi:hypothetical protein
MQPVKAMGKACAWNQRMVDIVSGTGLEIDNIEYSLLGTIVSIAAHKR